MPSNKEIAGWLREAAEKHMLTHGDDRWAETLLIRANLVEQMRCETCRWWDEVDVHGMTNVCGYSQFINHCPFDFYRCHWEGKSGR
jgi:hypothetical protein